MLAPAARSSPSSTRATGGSLPSESAQEHGSRDFIDVYLMIIGVQDNGVVGRALALASFRGMGG